MNKSNHLRITTQFIITAIGLVFAGACQSTPRPVDPTISSLVPGDAVALGFNQEKLNEISAALQHDVTSGKLPGAYLLITRHGQIAYSQGFGVQGPKQQTPMSEETIFRIFSMTKPIVTVAAMTFVEQGKLSIDDPVSKYLPEYANLTVLQPDGTRQPAATTMLVRHLMSHTSGLIYGFMQPDTWLSKAYAAAGEGDPTISARELARRLANLPLMANPGSAWHYSRATDVLGALIEVVAEQPLDVVVRQRVTGPLGMTDTKFFQASSSAARFAEPKQSELFYYDYAQPTALLQGGGGLSSTPEDYLRFTEMLRNNGSYRGVTIIERETLDRMRTAETNHAIREQGSFFIAQGPATNSMEFGLGFSIVTDDTRQRPANGTISWSGIAGTEFWIDPKNDLGVIFMIQDHKLLVEYQEKNRNWVYDALSTQ
jgi:CubicO group peptidase (beta-lactamase class C family)